MVEANEAGRGGGLFLGNSKLQVLPGGQLGISRNSAGSGGGMYAVSSPELQIKSTWFTSNRRIRVGVHCRFSPLETL